VYTHVLNSTHTPDRHGGALAALAVVWTLPPTLGRTR
jgi:hypothetical protein